MRSRLLLALALLSATAATRASADPASTAPAPTPAVAVSPVPTAIPTFMSNPPVTPDPTFIDASYAERWPHISLPEAQRLQKSRGVIFVDGRSQMEWDQSHVKGALAMPLGEFDRAFATEEGKLRKARVLVAYCHGKGCHLADGLAQRLMDKGLHNVAVFWGGFPEWHDNRLPLVDKSGRSVPYPGVAH